MAYITTISPLFCTTSDVRARADLLTRNITDVSEDTFNKISDAEVEKQITLASGLVLGALEGYYGGASALEDSTPYITRPISNVQNKSKVELLKVGYDISLITTELYTIKLKAPTSSANKVYFDLWGSVSGNQGAGNNGTNFVSTNLYIQILTSYWYLGPDNDYESIQDDEIYFSTYKHKKIIVDITSLLAAGRLLRALLATSSEEGSRVGDKCIKEALDWLEKLANPDKSGISLTTAPTPDINFTGISYKISSLGKDDTNYSGNIDSDDEDYETIGFDN